MLVANANANPTVSQPIVLVLLDIPPMLPVLDGVVMELQDCALPLLRGEQTLGGGEVTMDTANFLTHC